MMCSNNNEGQKGKKSINEQVKQIFFILLLLIIFILSLTLFSFYKSSSFAFDEYDSLKDIHVLKSKIHSVNKDGDPHDIKGKITITEISDNLVLINGEIFNLSPGTIHGFHIVDFIDLDTPTKAFAHFNPYNEKHSCPSNHDSSYHAGDLGNVIADSKGVAKFNFKTKLSIKSISGRGIVLLKGEDLCNENQIADKFEDIIGYGVISVGNYQKKAEIDVKQNWMIKEYNKRKIEQNIKKEIKNKENIILPTKSIEIKNNEMKQPLDRKTFFNTLNNEKIIPHITKPQSILKVQPTEMRYKEKNISIEKIKNETINKPLPQEKESLISIKNVPKINEVKEEIVNNQEVQKTQSPLIIIPKKDEIKDKKVKSNASKGKTVPEKLNIVKNSQSNKENEFKQSNTTNTKENEIKKSNLNNKKENKNDPIVSNRNEKEIKPKKIVNERSDNNIIKKLIKTNESKRINQINDKQEIPITNHVNDIKKEQFTTILNSKINENNKTKNVNQEITNVDKMHNKMKSIAITEKKEEKLNQNNKTFENKEKPTEEQKIEKKTESEKKEKEIQQQKTNEVKSKEEIKNEKRSKPEKKEINQTKLIEDKKDYAKIEKTKDIISKKKEDISKQSTIVTKETKKEKLKEKAINKPEKKEVNTNIEKVLTKEDKNAKPDITKKDQDNPIIGQKPPEIKIDLDNKKQKENNKIDDTSLISKVPNPYLKTIIANNREKELDKHQKTNKDNSNNEMIIPKIENDLTKEISSNTQNEKKSQTQEKTKDEKIINQKESINIKKETKKPKEFYLPMNPPVIQKNKTSVTFYTPTQLKEEMAKRNLVFPGTSKKNEKTEKLGTVTITESVSEKESPIKVIRNEKEGGINILQHQNKENEKNEVNMILNKKLQNAPIGQIEFVNWPEGHPELNISEEVIYPRPTNVRVILNQNNNEEHSSPKYYIPLPSKDKFIPSTNSQEKKKEKDNKITDDFTFFVQSKPKNTQDKPKDPTVHFMKKKIQEKNIGYYLDQFKNELSKLMDHQKA